MPRQKKRNKLVLGVTGSFASGKSSVARILKGRGVEIIDADKLAHACLRPGHSCHRRIKAHFGATGRKKLGEIVFNDRSELKKLNSIIHPEVIRQIKSRIARSRAEIIILDAPLLIEAGLKNIVDKLIVVSITGKERIKRLRLRSGLKSSQIMKRLKAQIPLSAKLRAADFIIDNSGTLDETRKQVRKIAQQVLPRRVGKEWAAREQICFANLRRKLWKN
jgi:dephospho-CoA kinase